MGAQHRSDLAPERAARAAALAVVLSALAAGSAQAAGPAGDAAQGAKLFLQCRACHTVGPADANTVGPNLYGVFGAKAAVHPGYKFSTALTASGVTWNAESLDAWLKKPTALVPGTKMAFAGVAAPKARQDIIAYLATLKPAKKTKP